jgi:tRNA (cytidine/uridine-2'-O-)-methyltransferase
VPFHVVLVEPEIPNNTGNIGRTCVATGCVLHLVHPLSFDTSERACRRAGLDYWPRLDVREHGSFEAYVRATPGARRWLLTTRGERAVFEACFEPGDHLIFGRETTGLPEEVLGRFPDRLLVLPMVAGERSLNVATAVCAAVYEGIRQGAERGWVSVERGRLEAARSVEVGE